MNDLYKEEALNFIQSVWYSLAEKIFKEIIEITGLDKEREDALRTAVLRPNDFDIEIKN